jgi:hypothetical protein
MFGWFFATLLLVALLSQPGASHDEWFHASSIWCGQGERDPYCREIFDNGIDVPYAITNIDARNCSTGEQTPLLCPTERTGESTLWTNTGLYPPLFYFTMSWFVVPSVEVSILLVRFVNALLVSAVLALTAWLLPARYRLVLLLVILTTFTASGYFLFASINPSSWTVFGVGVGWLALHASLVSGEGSRGRRTALGIVGLVGLVMAVGSRWDALAFVALAATMSIFQMAWVRFPRHRSKMIPGLALAGAVLYVGLRVFTPLSPGYYLDSLYTYSDGQPDNTAFFSYNLLQGLPNALRAIGTVPSLSAIYLPEWVGLAATALLSFLMLRTFNHRETLQLWGFIVASISIAVLIMAQVATNDGRDEGAIEARYVLPILVFAVGWWFLLGPENLAERVARYLQAASATATILFALTVFTVAERYVDRQTFGLRILPEGPDQWWWTWMPVGPNVPVVLAPFCLSMFFRSYLPLAVPVPVNSDSA